MPGEMNRPRSTASLVVLSVAALALTVALIGLGTWQVHRRAWKLDLIARVDSRIHAVPVAPPGPRDWPSVTAAADEYRHVKLTGTFLNDRETLVQAVTDYGPGFWVLTPMKADAGFTVLVNRGFVPADLRDPAARQAGQGDGATTLTGLLRMTEPGGSFLRHNDAASDRWYSRDVAAIAARRDLGVVAPYFVDADGPPQPGRYPMGGLTAVSFPNNHLVYAITWYGLALMLASASVWVGREEWLRRRGTSAGAGPPVPV